MEFALRTDMQLDAPEKDLLRFNTCGSVDDGKSTLIGRLLHDTELIFDDQLAALVRDSERQGTSRGDIDFALLLDGLEAEREQGITIDVAYRFFATRRRSFIVADTPGHEQFTRNMATGASNAELAVILIDARKGVLVQTKRHSFICSLLGIRHVVVAVNKIDLINSIKASSTKLPEITPPSPPNLAFCRSSRFQSRPASATMSRGRPNTHPGTEVPPFWITWKRSTFNAVTLKHRFGFRFSLSIDPIRISAAMLEPWHRARSAREIRLSSPIQEQRRASPKS